MNPSTSSNSYQFPPESNMGSVNQMTNFSRAMDVPPRKGASVIPVTNIHVNPKLCASRNIYINRAFTSTAALPQTTSHKPERIHYNPKFFSNPDDSSHMKKELKIHVNRKFFVKESDKIKQSEVMPDIAHNSLSSGCAIHVNPIFLKNLVPEPSASIQGITERLNPTVTPSSTPRQKYVSKYKIIKKKCSPALSIGCSPLKNSRFKKVNQIVKKKRIKIVKGKLLKFVSQNVINQRIKNKSLSLKNPYKYQVSKSNKSPPTPTNKVINTKFKLVRSAARIPLNSAKKSLLQQKIESRRRVKSSLNSRSSKVFVKSRYKYVRPGSEQVERRLPSPSKSYNRYKYVKSNNTEGVAGTSEFKRISKNKIVRKSVLQKQIESRMRTRRSLSTTAHPSGDRVSQYKIVRSRVGSPRKSSLAARLQSSADKTPKPKKGSMVYSSAKYRADKRKKIAAITKKLRKNNEPCPFYNRFGRCKGKDRGTCQKLHDPKYITICKRFLKGDCKDEKCTLSHDIRPEKMPTCHHYLSGLCKKADCPYLHIKVNPKAPICRAFLQGFCPQVLSCTKRHEFICPSFAEKGCCTKGKSCRLPHRTTTTESKLLGPDQTPLVRGRRAERPPPPTAPSPSPPVPPEVSMTPEASPQQPKSKEFTRYFLAPLTDPQSAESSSGESDSEDSSNSSSKSVDESSCL